MPDDAADQPAHFWPDEDPDALPDIVQQETALQIAGSSSECVDERSDQNAVQPTSPANGGGAVTHSSNGVTDGSSPSNHPQPIPEPADSNPPDVGSSLGETESPNNQAAEERNSHPPRFPLVSGGILPPSEETQEVPGSAGGKSRRSFFGRVANAFGWLMVLAVFALIGFAALYYRYASDRLYNIQFESNRTIILRVAPGDRLNTIIEKLRDEGLLGSYLGIDDAYLLRYLAWLNENSHKIKTGVYRLNSSMSLSEIYDKLIAGSQDFKITIPEGKTAKETAAIIKKKLDGFSEERFLQLVENPEFISRLGLSVPSLEGYLYPDTYFFAPGMKEEDIIRTMVENFVKRAETNLRDIERTETSIPLTFHEHVIVASLVEREARLDTERPLIASVIFNRLKKGMKLDIDATINYALGDWGKRLTFEDLKTSSPYNTYLHKGLPPGPICNPQMNSLVATFKPAQTNYLFYVYKGDGSHAFAETYEEHLANIRLYRKSSPLSRSATQTSSQSSGAFVPTAVVVETTASSEEEVAEKDPEGKVDDDSAKSRSSSAPEKKQSGGRRSRATGNRR
ncbi:MAG: endolytic transglycosylase MltG [Candidatus Sumerlaeaceae bacterium]|nr:endolytic transglycosylase MltG [Candidatus Sumerlaeaceae bacterium]